MQKKNVIFFIVDSVCYDYILNNDYINSPVPFLLSLKNKSIWCENMYSQAPFTEAAIMPIFTGQNLLDNGGYLERFKYRKTIMQCFKDNGYETFINHYYPCVYPSQTFKDIDNLYWINAFDFNQIWGYRLEYYRPLYLKNQLTDIEKKTIAELLDDNLKSWILSDTMLLNGDKAVKNIIKNSDLTGIDKEIDILKNEYHDFLQDKSGYIDRLFKTAPEHTLLKIPMHTLNKKVNESDQKKIREKYRSTFQRIYNTNKKYNLRNSRIPFGQSVKAAFSRDMFASKQYLSMYKNAVFDKDLYQRIDGEYPSFKAALCMRSQIDDGLQLIDARDKEKPFFFYFHVDDAHAPENFFSSDISDFTILDKEFNDINKYLDDLKPKFHGSLTMNLSLVYVDNCLKYMFSELEKRGLLGNTAIAIMADHGFSYGYRPFRTNYVNNSHKENYHIPFIIYDESLTPSIKHSAYMTKDIAPSVIDACGLKIPEEMNGVSILNNDGRNYSITEYMGGGCPDMLRRPIILGVRTNQYAVTVNVKLNQNFEDCVITDLYDLKKDASEEHNLKNTSDKQDIANELAILKERFNELKNNFNKTEHSFNKKGEC